MMSVLASMGLVSLRLSKAPEGYEDETGFHFVNAPDKKRTRAGHLPAAGVHRRPKKGVQLAVLPDPLTSRGH